MATHFMPDRHASVRAGRVPKPSRTSRMLDVAKCPLCGVPLVARMVGGKPSFPCNCSRHAPRAVAKTVRRSA
jgi:hypothetical protein